MTKTTIVNTFADDNLGGAAITRAAILLAREVDPDASVALVAVNAGARFDFQHRTSPDVDILPPPFVAGGRLGLLLDLFHSALLLVVPGLRWRTNATIDRLRESDHVISKGGYVFRERGGLAGLSAGWFTMWPLMFGRRAGATSTVYSHSVGPWATRASRSLSRFALRHVDVICPRDPDSASRLAEIAPTGQVLPMPDCVFGMYGDPALFGDDWSGPVERDELVIVPRRLPRSAVAVQAEGGDRFWNWQIEVARLLIDAFPELRVSLITQASSERAACEEFADALGLDRACVELCDDPRDAIRHYVRAGLTLSCRMHGAIFATVSGSPTLLVDIAAGKSKPVFELLGLAQIVIPSTLAPVEVLAAARGVVEPETQRSLAGRVERAGDAVREVRSTVASRLAAQGRTGSSR